MDGTSACAVLGVPPRASRQTIKRAFRRLAQHAHPDVSGSATEFRRLKQAYDVALSHAPKQAKAPTSTLTIGPAERETVGTTATPVGRSPWLTSIATDYPATEVFDTIVRNASSRTDIAATKRSVAFAEALEQAMQAA